jgi:hypothetical protein
MKSDHVKVYAKANKGQIAVFLMNKFAKQLLPLGSMTTTSDCFPAEVV